MYKKKSFPERDEFVICRITRLTPYSAFAELIEYQNLEGMIHTSEMRRRTVRNMRTILKVGKVVVCKVMDLDKEKKHINLSLRWVGSSQKRTKLLEWKREKRADDLLHVFAKLNKKLSVEDIYKKIGYKLLDKYGVLYPAFEEIAKGDRELLKILDLDSKTEKNFYEFLKNRISISKAVFKGNLILKSEASNGLEVIKKSFKSARELAQKMNSELEIIYLAAPKYRVKIKADDKKQASQTMDKIVEMLEKKLSKEKGVVEFAKT